MSNANGNLDALINVCVSYDDITKLQVLAGKYKNVFYSAGLHPNNVASEQMNLFGAFF